jgi:hypothetical protein
MTRKPDPWQTNEARPFLMIGDVSASVLAPNRYSIHSPGGDEEVEGLRRAILVVAPGSAEAPRQFSEFADDDLPVQADLHGLPESTYRRRSLRSQIHLSVMSSKSLLNMSASLSAEGYSELALGSLAVNRPLDGLANGLDDLLAHVAVLGLRPLGRRAHPAGSLPGMSAAFHGCSLGWPAASCADGHLCDEVYLVWLCDRCIRAACCCGPPWVSHNLHRGRASSLAQPRSALPPRLSRRCTLETPSRRTSRTARHHLVSPLVAVRRTCLYVSPRRPAGRP